MNPCHRIHLVSCWGKKSKKKTRKKLADAKTQISQVVLLIEFYLTDSIRTRKKKIERKKFPTNQNNTIGKHRFWCRTLQS